MHLHCRIATVNENSHYKLQRVFTFSEKCGSFFLSAHPFWESGFHMKTVNELYTQTGYSAVLNAPHSALILCINRRQGKEDWNEGKDQSVRFRQQYAIC